MRGVHWAIARLSARCEGKTLGFVMPGHSSLPCADCVNLSAIPGIHVLQRINKEDVDGRVKPGHDERD